MVSLCSMLMITLVNSVKDLGTLEVELAASFNKAAN